MSNKQNKKIRREIRHTKNKINEVNYKKSAWDSGKLIEEKHNGETYSIEFTILLANRLVNYLKKEYNKSLKTENPSINFIQGFRKYRPKIRDLIILWNPLVPEDYNYILLKGLLEIYWDEVLYKNFDSLLIYMKNNYDK